MAVSFVPCTGHGRTFFHCPAPPHHEAMSASGLTLTNKCSRYRGGQSLHGHLVMVVVVMFVLQSIACRSQSLSRGVVNIVHGLVLSHVSIRCFRFSRSIHGLLLVFMCLLVHCSSQHPPMFLLLLFMTKKERDHQCWCYAAEGLTDETEWKERLVAKHAFCFSCVHCNS